MHFTFSSDDKRSKMQTIFSLFFESLHFYFTLCRILCLYRMYESIYKKSSKNFFFFALIKKWKSRNKNGRLCIIFDSTIFFYLFEEQKASPNERWRRQKLKSFVFLKEIMRTKHSTHYLIHTFLALFINHARVKIRLEG